MTGTSDGPMTLYSSQPEGNASALPSYNVAGPNAGGGVPQLSSHPHGSINARSTRLDQDAMSSECSHSSVTLYRFCHDCRQLIPVNSNDLSELLPLTSHDVSSMAGPSHHDGSQPSIRVEQDHAMDLTANANSYTNFGCGPPGNFGLLPDVTTSK